MTAVANSIAPAQVAHPARRVSVASTAAWCFFLLLNATLFMRPADIFWQLAGVPVYEVIVLLCLVLSIEQLLWQLRPAAIAANPITFCVFGLLVAVVASHLSLGNLDDAITWGIDFVKVVIYYVLLVTLVNSPSRLRQFMLWIAVFALGLVTIALLQYYHVIDLKTVAPMEEFLEGSSEDAVVRLQAAGIYANPNDLARIAVVGITVCIFGLARRAHWLARLPWLLPMGVFVHSLRLTYSRGGLLALLAGLLVLFSARFGWKKGTVLMVLFLPAAVLFSGRQTDINTSKGTAQSRIALWSKGLAAFRASPVFGIGAHNYFDMAGNHAHNSFLEAYTDLGVFGGMFYVGAFYLATTGLFRLRSSEMAWQEPELWRMRPYVLSLVVGTIAGQLSSSREYSEPTYMILGVSSAYLALAARLTPQSLVPVSTRLLFRLGWIAVASFVVLYLYTKVAFRTGG